ncbi:MAG: ATP-dependent helicase/deoxyribonuclease subunit B [Pelotomaculum sp. PtaU1.Bin035]|nr:MAG: ATP-dependent helicase/deoxyribonuclease subunit B [Pelotomaculum sp. PtaU1.Bin035]
MTLRFIIGRAGTGKTRACLDAVRQELLSRPAGPPLILLVPEQASFQTEYALAATAGVKGFIRAQVLSFRRLAFRVLQEVGGAARSHISELGKRMVLRRLLEQRRGELRVFGRSANQPGFVDTLARTLGEMKTYCVFPDGLAIGAGTLRDAGGNSLLVDKLEDLRLMYSELEACLDGRFVDPDDYLNLLAGRLGDSSSVRGAEVWVDGFTGFTPQEYRVLAALMCVAERVNVTLCAGLVELNACFDETDLFYPLKETYDNLCEIAARERVTVERPQALDGKTPCRFQNKSIARLEKYFFHHPATPDNSAGDGVLLAAAANRRAELEGLAREITRLCRDRGYRYRDIVVLTRDLESYAHLVSTVFEDHGIPVFIDRKRPVMSHPLVELVRSALEVVVKDWAYDPVFRFLKTDLAPLAREEVDLLENYVLAHGIRGSRWIDKEPWVYRRRLTLGEDLEISQAESRELDEINRIRRQAAMALSGFHRAVRAAGCVRETTVALFNLLAGLEVPEILESWSRKAEAEGRLEVAREHSQVWSGLIALMDQIVEVLGDEVLKPEEYAMVMDAGFESMRLGLIPPGLDQVVVGSLERSRSPEARVSFIVGVSESVLPARMAGQGILSEAERDKLQVVGLRLAPGAHRKVFDEQYLVYVALTRAAERLVLSYPLADDEGGAIMPSPVIARVKELLPRVEERVWPVEPNVAMAEDLEFITNPGRSLSYLAAQLREAKAGRPINPLWWDVYSWFVRGVQREKCERTLSGLFFSNREGRLAGGVSRLLYGRPLKTSISSVERFRACPFAHFLSQGLRLQERAIFKLGSPDMGQFFHAALKLFGDRIKEQGMDWGELDRKECRKMAGEVVDYLAPRLQSEILLSTARQRYLTGKLKRTVQRAVLVLSEHSRRGKFRPVGLELAFGPEGSLPAMSFSLSDGSEMVVSGRIDRIDAAPAETGVYLRVIDYKSGRVTINLSDIFNGLKLQLLAYLDVAARQALRLVGGPGLPGAILYFSLDDPLIKTSGEVLPEEELEKRILKEMKMKGMVLADPAVVRMMDSGLVGTSDLIPVQFKKDGDFTAHSAVLTEEQFKLLRAYLHLQLISAGNDIVSGVVNIAPYRQEKLRSCQYCIFQPVCQFDLLMEGNTYRLIRHEKDDIIWSKLAELIRGEDGE